MSMTLCISWNEGKGVTEHRKKFYSKLCNILTHETCDAVNHIKN